MSAVSNNRNRRTTGSRSIAARLSPFLDINDNRTIIVIIIMVMVDRENLLQVHKMEHCILKMNMNL